MKEISLALFKNQELLSILLTCLVAGLFVFLAFSYTPLKKKKHLSLITLLSIISAVFYFWKLGTTSFPQTWWQAQENNEVITFEVVGDTTNFDAIYIIGGGGDNNALEQGYQVWFNDLEILGSNDGNSWDIIATLNNNSQYLGWIISPGNWSYRYISINIPSFRSVVHEFALKETDSDSFLTLTLIDYSNSSNSYSPENMIDETSTIPITPTAYHSAYFDEIYHVRNAWEIANGQHMYSSVHPLLGTSIIASGIKIFGMNPFGWRFMGALFSTLIIPLFYLLAKALFKKESIALFCASILAADFMVISTARIGTLEPFSIFFILLMTYFMVLYVQTDFTDSLRKQLTYLSLSGISMGLAISVKWTGAYAAVGLAILFFSHLFMQFKKANELKTKTTLEAQQFTNSFKKRVPLIIGWCFIFFIFIPFFIYCISFFFTKVWKNDNWSIQNVINHSIGMYNYHANLTATHPYQSTWYEWLFDLQPIWYFVKKTSTDVIYTISSFNNPLVSWVGVIGIIYTSVYTWINKSKIGWIILVGYFSALVPWMLVERCVFAYHYYPALPFLILGIGFMFSVLEENLLVVKENLFVFVIIVWILFILFLPALTGWATTVDYVRFLKWLPGWYFGG